MYCFPSLLATTFSVASNPAVRRRSIVRRSSASFAATRGSASARRRCWMGLSAVSSRSSTTSLGAAASACAVRLEERVVAGDDVAALPGLGVLELAEDVREVLDDGVGVGHRVARLRERVDAPVGDGADDREQDERRRRSRARSSFRTSTSEPSPPRLSRVRRAALARACLEDHREIDDRARALRGAHDLAGRGHPARARRRRRARRAGRAGAPRRPRRRARPGAAARGAPSSGALGGAV